MTPFTPTIWDQLLAVPIAIILGLTAAAFVQILATPRIFRRPERRMAAAFGLAIYFALIIAGAPEAVGGRWQADGWLLVRSFLQTIPSIVLLVILRKLESVNTDRPLKSSPLARC